MVLIGPPCSTLAPTVIHALHIGPIEQQRFTLQKRSQMTCDLCLISGFLLHWSKIQIPWPTRPRWSATCLSPKLIFTTSSLCTSHLAFTLFLLSVPRMCQAFPISGFALVLSFPQTQMFAWLAPSCHTSQLKRLFLREAFCNPLN